MDVARLNFSHGTLEEHAETAHRVRDAASRAGRAVAVLQDLPGPKLRIGPLRDGIAELKPGDRVTFACGSEEEGDADRMTLDWAGLPAAVAPGEVLYLADGSVRLRVETIRAEACELDAIVEIGGGVASRHGLEHPGRAQRSTLGPGGGPRAVGLRRVDRGRHGRVVLRAQRRRRRAGPTAHPAAADRQDREATGRRERRGDRPGRRLRDGRPRRPRHRAGPRGGPDGPEAGDRAGGPPRPPVDHRHADARLDGRLLAPDARRGDRRRQRDPRRHRRGDALAGDGGRRPPGRGRRHDGADRRARRARGALRAVERAPCLARRPRPGLHRRLQRLPRRARARPRRARDPHAVGPLGAPDLRPPARRADLRALPRPRDRAPLRPDVGRRRPRRCAATR